MQASSHSLTFEQRDTILREIDADGFSVLPLKLSLADVALLSAATTFHADARRAVLPPGSQRSVKVSNIVDIDDIFLELAMYQSIIITSKLFSWLGTRPLCSLPTTPLAVVLSI